jgi:hypothetical protein
VVQRFPGISGIEFPFSPVFIDVKFTEGAIGAGQITIFGGFKNDLLYPGDILCNPGWMKPAIQIYFRGNLKKTISFQKTVFIQLINKFFIGETAIFREFIITAFFKCGYMLLQIYS